MSLHSVHLHALQAEPLIYFTTASNTDQHAFSRAVVDAVYADYRLKCAYLNDSREGLLFKGTGELPDISGCPRTSYFLSWRLVKDCCYTVVMSEDGDLAAARLFITNLLVSLATSFKTKPEMPLPSNYLLYPDEVMATLEGCALWSSSHGNHNTVVLADPSTIRQMTK